MNMTLRGPRRTTVRRPRAPRDRTEFSGEVFDAILKDMKSGTIPLKKVMLSDNEQYGLRILLRSTGTATFHVHYIAGDARPMIKIGDHPEMTVADARKIAKTIQSLSDRGIDPQEGLHKRLVRELKEKGDKWRP